MMLRTVRVYGRLAKFLKRRKFEVAVSSAAEAVRFLVTNFPQLERHMSEQYYRVSIGSYSLTLNELHDPVGQQEIKIVPVIGGAGSSTTNILIGVALIAGAFIIPGLAAGAVLNGSLSYGTASFIASAAVYGGLLGASLVLTGVSQLLTPAATTTTSEQQDPKESYSFSGVQQTSREGVPVPVVYGELLVGSVVISAAVDTRSI